MKKNYYVDLLLFISGVICIATGVIIDFHLFSGGKATKIMLTDWHIYSGYTMMAGLLLHLAWHWGWVKNVTKLLFGNKAKTEAIGEKS